MINTSFMKILYVIFRKNSAKKLLVPLISCASPQELLDWGADATLACHGGATAYEAGGCHAVRRCLAKETRWNCLPLRCSSLSFGAQRDLWYFLQSEISRNLRKVPGAAIPSLPVSNWALPQTQTITQIILKPSLSLRILESFSSMRGNWQCTWNCRLLSDYFTLFEIALWFRPKAAVVELPLHDDLKSLGACYVWAQKSVQNACHKELTSQPLWVRMFMRWNVFHCLRSMVLLMNLSWSGWRSAIGFIFYEVKCGFFSCQELWQTLPQAPFSEAHKSSGDRTNLPRFGVVFFLKGRFTAWGVLVLVMFWFQMDEGKSDQW